MSEILTIGEPIVTFASKEPDVSLRDALEFHKILGGAELNVAIGAQRLGHSVDYISQVGEEPLGDYVIKTIKEHHVGTRYITRDADYWTAFQLKDRVTQGNPTTQNYRRGSAAAHLTPAVVDQIDLADVRAAHMSGIFPAISATAEAAFRTLLKRLEAANILTTFDPNLRPTLWPSRDKMVTTLNELAGHAEIVLPGVEEGEILMGSTDPEKIADFYLRGARTKVVIVKVGPVGAYVKQQSGESYTVTGFKVAQVADTVGAGDGFAMGVLTALLEHKSLRSAVMRGNAVGALQVQTYGDNDGYPTPAGLQAFYQQEGVVED
ncbi:sugar kinase [Levilactobacillus brevis]|uniref:sugar kinase n=1 Tax=Levilactobacillus brevis TaxID=1580 RepID=UPI001CFF83D8|nr:sugar kinase [Levilactobacillus brevis]MCB5232498.1 sugar kinase [Levilactobacillus brevis]